MKRPWRKSLFPTARHEHVEDLLRRLVSEGAADFYADAYGLTQQEPPYRSATHLIGHLMREVEGEVLKVLTSLPEVPRELSSREKPSRGDQTSARSAVSAGHGEAGKGDGHRKKVVAILQALDLAHVPQAQKWIEYAGGVAGWHKVAHRNELRAPRSPDETFHDRADAFTSVLELVLSRVEMRYVPILKQLEPHIIASPPSSDDINKLKPYLGTGVTALGHIFDRVDATWLEPLRALGAFDEPPDVQMVDEHSFVSPWWPQADYLTRLAADHAEAVAATIESVPTSQNQNIYCAFVEAGARMPSTAARRVANYVERWLAQQPRLYGLLPLRLSDLVTKLLVGDEHDLEQAVRLLQTSLRLTPADASDDFSRPSATMSDFEFGELLQATVPALALRDPERARELLFTLMAPVEKADWWRESVEGHDTAGADDPEDLIFSALRDLYLRHAGSDGTTLREAVEHLGSRGPALYTRLALHLLRVHGQLDSTMVIEHIEAQARRGDAAALHELQMLFRDQVCQLVPDDQARAFAAIRHLCEDRDALEGDISSENRAELQRLGRRRLMEWWHLIESNCPAVAAEYTTLAEEFGAPIHVPRHQVGHLSPLSATELRAMEDDELIAFLRDWSPSNEDFFRPSRAGLADELKLLATDQPERVSRVAKELRGLPPSYVTNALWGIHGGIQARSRLAAETSDAGPLAMDWNSVLDLAEWTARQSAPADTDWRRGYGTWTSARRFAVEVLKDAAIALLSRNDGLATRAWIVLRRLMDDADPPAEKAVEPGDEIHLAINTVRGQALDAAFKLARQLRSQSAEHLQEMLADVLNELTRRVDPGVEGSIAIRCMHAMYFNELFEIDAEVAAKTRDLLFPTLADVGNDTHSAAWRTFLKHNASCIDVFDTLKDCYEVSARSAGVLELSVATELGRHLIRLALAGALDLAAGGHLSAFVANASPRARRDALAWIGHAAFREAENMKAEMVNRMMALWTWWSDTAVDKDHDDATAFCWWFASDAFDTSWSLPELERVLDRTGGRIQRDDLVIKKLTGEAAIAPERVAACLNRLVDARDNWRVLRNEAELRKALKAILATGAQEQARTLASRLVALGYRSFQNLGDD